MTRRRPTFGIQLFLTLILGTIAGVVFSACGTDPPPGPAPDTALIWNQGQWNVHNWN